MQYNLTILYPSGKNQIGNNTVQTTTNADYMSIEGISLVFKNNEDNEFDSIQSVYPAQYTIIRSITE